jgi:hypothetical protein
MRRWHAAVLAGLSVATLLAAGAETAVAAPRAPGYSVTATLRNNTGCTLTLTGGTLFAGQLTQEPTAVIAPHGTGTWKATGYDAFGDADADAVVVYEVSGCPQGGGQEGYFTKNDPTGTSWGDGACAAVQSPLLKSFYTGVPAYHAAVTINLDVFKLLQAPGSGIRPELGGCGGLPIGPYQGS